MLLLWVVDQRPADDLVARTDLLGNTAAVELRALAARRRVAFDGVAGGGPVGDQGGVARPASAQRPGRWGPPRRRSPPCRPGPLSRGSSSSRGTSPGRAEPSP